MQTTHGHAGAPKLRRRSLLLGASGLAGGIVVGCGGGGDSPGPAPAAPPPASPPAAALRLQTHPAGGATARAILENERNGSVALFTTTTGALDQVRYVNAGTSARVFYDPNGAIERVVNESTGEFITMTAVDANRTDFNLYGATGAWKSGFAVLLNSNGTYSVAEIISSSGLQGSQITGSLTGPLTAAFSLLPTAAAGLRAPSQLSASTTLFARYAPRRATPTMLATLDRLTDRMFPAAHAQSFTGSNLINLVKGALIATGGALVYTSTLPLAPLIGTAIMGYGAYRIYQELTNVANTNWGQVDAATNAILGESMDDFRDGSSNPLDTLRSRVADYLNRGASALANLPTLDSVRGLAQTTANTVASAVTLTARTAWQAVTSSPPPGSTPVQGLLVDNGGTSYPTSGTYDPAARTVTFDTGPSAGVRVQGTGTTGSGTTNGTGTFTVTNNGAAAGSGTFTSRTQSLGVCQTNTSSGGQGAFTHVYDMGRDSGTFQLTYEMYNIPDRLEVRSSSGTTVYSTSGLVSGSRTVQVNYSGGRMVYVIVTAPTSGTAWDYTIGCP